jgi:hypothetical protein
MCPVRPGHDSARETAGVHRRKLSMGSKKTKHALVGGCWCVSGVPSSYSQKAWFHPTECNKYRTIYMWYQTMPFVLRFKAPFEIHGTQLNMIGSISHKRWWWQQLYCQPDHVLYESDFCMRFFCNAIHESSWLALFDGGHQPHVLHTHKHKVGAACSVDLVPARELHPFSGNRREPWWEGRRLQSTTVYICSSHQVKPNCVKAVFHHGEYIFRNHEIEQLVLVVSVNITQHFNWSLCGFCARLRQKFSRRARW